MESSFTSSSSLPSSVGLVVLLYGRQDVKIQFLSSPSSSSSSFSFCVYNCGADSTQVTFIH